MSFTSDHVVVSFAAFTAYRERRNHVAAVVRSDQDPSAVTPSTDLAGADRLTAGDESGGADAEVLPGRLTQALKALPKPIPR